VHGHDAPGLLVRALGEAGLTACPDWRAAGLPRATLLASPAIWQGDTMLAAPLARTEAEWQARPVRAPEQFLLSILSH
jgi:tRNA(Ile)-lysidine synthase